MYVVTVRKHKKISNKYRKPNTLLDDLNKDRHTYSFDKNMDT